MGLIATISSKEMTSSVAKSITNVRLMGDDHRCFKRFLDLVEGEPLGCHRGPGHRIDQLPAVALDTKVNPRLTTGV